MRRTYVNAVVGIALKAHLKHNFLNNRFYIFPHLLKNRFETRYVNDEGVEFPNGLFFEVPTNHLDHLKCVTRLIQTGTKPLSYLVFPYLKSLVRQ